MLASLYNITWLIKLIKIIVMAVDILELYLMCDNIILCKMIYIEVYTANDSILYLYPSIFMIFTCSV
jgi:membrane protease subunit (stomatin/prohibitin family)